MLTNHSLSIRVLLIGLFILFAGLQYTFWGGDKGWVELHHLRNQLEQTRTQNLALKERNDALRMEVIDLKKEGSEAIEERARSELGLIKPDETFYQIIETE